LSRYNNSEQPAPNGNTSKPVMRSRLWISCAAAQFNFAYGTVLLLVLRALGWAMTALSLVIYLPRRAIAALGIAPAAPDV